MELSQENKDFIIQEESGGKSYYEKVYKSTFTWPGESSGPTTAIGIDCAYYNKKELKEMFGPYVTEEELKKIYGAIGKTGLAGKEYTKKLKGIIIIWDESVKIFEEFTLPKFIALTIKTYPGVDELCENAFLACLSIIFNRGTSLKGPRRKEMLDLRTHIKNKDYKKMAASIRSMKRLWPKGSGLIGRRERESRLVESCA